MLLLALLACAPDVVVIDDTAADDLDDTPDDTSSGDDAAWDGATLVILAPESGAFLPYGEAAAFEAVVQDADGVATDFAEIAWSSSVDTAWSLSGAMVADDGLDVGTHAISATAVLPNGDRLVHTAGGVLVQSAYAGVYVGTLAVEGEAEYEGTLYSAGCSGALTIVVDAYGEAVTGDAGCSLSLQGNTLDMAYAIALENAEGTLAGVATADLTYVTYDFEVTGELTEDGALSGSFADSVYGYMDVAGTLEATRLTRDLSSVSQ